MMNIEIDENLKHVIDLLQSRGVEISDIADCARYLQADYHCDLTSEELEESVIAVLQKRETQYAVLTGIALDVMAETGAIKDKNLEKLLMEDAPLYGVDEVLAYGICNTYGSIALTNFGFIDKQKYGIISKLNLAGKNTGTCNTFLDDIVGAIAASAASRFAHRWKAEWNKEQHK